MSMDKMHKEKYEDLMLRFAKELHEVGVTENLTKIVHAQIDRTPNAASAWIEEATRKIHYQYDGYSIEAVRTIKLTVKKAIP